MSNGKLGNCGHLSLRSETPSGATGESSLHCEPSSTVKMPALPVNSRVPLPSQSSAAARICNGNG